MSGTLYFNNPAPNQILDSNSNVIGIYGPGGLVANVSQTYTWAQIQALVSPATGMRVYASDIGYAEFIYNGSIWTRNTPLQLLGSGVPFVFGVSGTFGSATASSVAFTAGTTLGTAVSYPYPCYLWVGTAPTGMTSNTWYYAVLTSGTAATVYNNTYNGGTPVIPSSPANFASVTGAAYTSNVAGAIGGPYVQIPAKLLGINGALRYLATQVCTNAVNSYMGFGSFGTINNVFASGFLTAVDVGLTYREVRNRGATNAQITRNAFTGGSWDAQPTANNTQLAIDTTVLQYSQFGMQPVAATTWQILESFSVEAWLTY